MGRNLVTGVLFAVGLFFTPLCFGGHFDHAYFAAVEGDWSGEGELTSADGVSTPIHEEWSGAAEENRFMVQGTRQWGDESMEFRWTFTFNVSTELFEAEYWQTGMETELIFEVSLTDTKAEMRTPFGEQGGELLIVNSLISNGIEGAVTFANANGDALLEGTVKHKKRD